MVPILNVLSFNSMTAHWEFAYGPDTFKRITGKLEYPMLAINCYDKSTGMLVFDPFNVIECEELQIGVVGIASNIVDKIMPKHFSEGIRFTNRWAGTLSDASA